MLGVSSMGMVDITGKKEVMRIARARGRIKLRRETISRIMEKRVEKGDVFEVTKVAIINAVKKTAELLPFCHPIRITHVNTDITLGEDYIDVEVTVKSISKTGVEMEALIGACVGLLNIWDMVKMYEKDESGNYPYTSVLEVRVLEKLKLEGA